MLVQSYKHGAFAVLFMDPLLILIDHAQELGKVSIAVRRAGGRFRVVLYRENRQRFVPQSLYSSVVKINLPDFQIGITESVRRKCVAMVLGRDDHTPGNKILHGMVRSAMSERQLKSTSPPKAHPIS